MRLSTTLFAALATYAALSVAQSSSSGATLSIPVVTPTSLPSAPPPLSTESTSTSRHIGGSQVQPTSFTTSRRTISDVSTDRPPPSSSLASSIVGGSSTTTATSPPGTVSSVSSASSVAASATTSAVPNTASKQLAGISAGAMGLLVALGGVILV
ncbi:hypothetical protein FRC12_022726 [Ceratobasidium sp. 428]|nr:hypothetical protein FRC12_022726 [Ceratobasidium sp. 428]